MSIRWSYLAFCTYPVPSYEDDAEYTSCGNPAVAKVWREDYDEPAYACQEHLDEIIEVGDWQEELPDEF